MEHGMTKDNVLNLFRAREGRCEHTNDERLFGVGFDADGQRVFVYSTPSVGVKVSIDGDATFDIAGSSQFTGMNSRAVYRWLVKNAYGEEDDD